MNRKTREKVIIMLLDSISDVGYDGRGCSSLFISLKTKSPEKNWRRLIPSTAKPSKAAINIWSRFVFIRCRFSITLKIMIAVASVKMYTSMKKIIRLSTLSAVRAFRLPSLSAFRLIAY